MALTERGPRVAVGLLVAGAVLAGCSPAAPEGSASPSASPAPARSPDFKPGAAGAGDPYFPAYGNGGYDVDHYALKVRYDPGADHLTGVAKLGATATADLSRFNLDLAGLTVRSVRVSGAAAAFTREADELVVTPAQGIPGGTPFTVEVGYDGKPAPLHDADLGDGGFLHTSDGAVALGQPESASTWFPVNDHPSDKATYDVEITVPDGLSAISNGTPEGRTKAGGWTTWKWSERTPMASYLSTVVIGRYRMRTTTHKGRPVVTAVAADLPNGDADRAVAATVEVADHLESVFGPYPFDSYGGVVISDSRIRYALETQSRPVYSASFFERGPNDSVVAHEIAHQWFGDSVALKRWQDIWLNEGLATYAEWLWAEHNGRGSAQQAFDARYDQVPEEVWRTPPGRPGRANLFSESVYQRGGMAVHALRVAVGDEAFFTILKTWAAQRRDGNVTTAEFVAHAERVSGERLKDLFDAWLYGTTRPARPERR